MELCSILLDMTSSLQISYFVKGGKIPLLSLNEFGEKSRATGILGNFVNSPKSQSYWFIVFEKCVSTVKI